MTYYLDPDFDPKKLTKAELRSIMASHGILSLPPPSAKKEELLDLFYKEIIAKREKILAANKAVKAKSDGIVFLDESSRPSPKKPRASSKSPSPQKVTPKKSTRITKSPTKSIKNEEPVPPGTPPLVATYKLVTRLQNIENNGGTSNTSLSAPLKVSLRNIVLASVLGIFLIPYLYLKMWYSWPVFTESQLMKLESRPPLYLMCPYPSNSPIGSCSDGRLFCSVGYVERKYWFRFGSYCALDKERLSLIESMKKRIVAELQVRAGLSECMGKFTSHMEREELRLVILKSFKHLKAKNFNDYFDVCLKTLTQDGSSVSSWSNDENKVFYLARNPKYSYYCSLKIFMRRLVKEHPLEITFSIFALLFASAALIKFEINRRKAAQIAHFYIIICKILKEQSLNHRNDPTVPTYIAVNQLRDAVLIKLSGKQKSALWSKISNEMSRNSNIVESITTVRGEQTRVWEWIGADVRI